MAGLPDVLVDTDQQVRLLMGSQGMLPCRVEREVARVTWSKGIQLQTAKILLVYQHHDNMWMKAGYGYAEGIYDVKANFSLIINDVMMKHDGYYFCEILDVDTGRSFSNKTRVEVFGE